MKPLCNGVSMPDDVEVQPAADTTPTAGKKGVYNLSDIEVDTIRKIETAKVNFSLSISTYTDVSTALYDLLDLTRNIRALIRKKFGEDGLKFRQDGHTIADYQKAIETYIERRMRISPIAIRQMADSIFAIWDMGFSNPLNLTLPTERPDFFRRFTGALYGVLSAKQFDYNSYIGEYERRSGKRSTGGKDTDFFDFFAYSISKRRDYDLDTSINVVGIKRVSKSTGTIAVSERIYKYWGRSFTPVWVKKHIIWNAKQGFEAFSNIEEDIIMGDEGIFLADSRSSMNKFQIKYLQLQYALASHKNILFTVIQNYNDLDLRLRANANILMLVYERGSALIFSNSASFPIVRSLMLNAEKFEKNPRLLQNKQRAIFELKKDPNYMFTIHYDDIKWTSPRVWSKYMKTKAQEQFNAISKVQSDFKKHEKREMEEDGEEEQELPAAAEEPSMGV